MMKQLAPFHNKFVCQYATLALVVLLMLPINYHDTCPHDTS